MHTTNIYHFVKSTKLTSGEHTLIQYFCQKLRGKGGGGGRKCTVHEGNLTSLKTISHLM